jgi:thiol-disulfide isomerase/thioredoxin
MKILAPLFAGFAIAASTFAADISFPTLPIGASAPDFDLPGVDEKNYKLSDFKSSKALLIIFTCNHCPTAQYYQDRVNQIATDYNTKGVQVVAIMPNDPKSVRLDELGYTDLSDSFEYM